MMVKRLRSTLYLNDRSDSDGKDEDLNRTQERGERQSKRLASASQPAPATTSDQSSFSCCVFSFFSSAQYHFFPSSQPQKKWPLSSFRAPDRPCDLQKSNARNMQHQQPNKSAINTTCP